ncbi:MAG: hypothetical protein PVJ33_02025 [Lysobacterales bacterium]|jgi:uncharacterized membrane protein YkvI
MITWFRRFLLPGFVFQSLCIAGGYGTGRELVEFFLLFGPRGGLLGMLPATLLISAGCAVAFELGRMTHSYDYRSFLKVLLGRVWFVYEIAYLLSILLVLAVIGSAAGALFSETFGLSGPAGTILLLAVIAFLAFNGTKLIEGVLSVWSFVLYAVYAVVFVVSMQVFGPAIRDALANWPADPGWFLTGTRYGALQLALVPAVLFSTTHLTRRRDALIAGLLAGPILMIPALLFFIAMLGHFPDIVERPVPVNYVLEQLGSPVLLWAFPVVLIGTFIETGTGMIHAFNERLAAGLANIGRRLPRVARPVIAVALILGALLMSRWGIISLIAVGYGTMTWVFIGIFVIPLLTLGAWKVWGRPPPDDRIRECRS